MKTEKENGPGPTVDRHILIALDESENAKRALLYAADFLGGSAGFRATILNVVPVPPDDFFASEKDRDKWIGEQSSKSGDMLERYREVLLQSGFSGDKVATRVEVARGRSVAECVLEVQRELKCCTVIVGRRGISKREEFIYGSTSNKVLHSGKNCAVWVIE